MSTWQLFCYTACRSVGLNTSFTMSYPHQDTYLRLGIFRLEDVCVRIQEEMEDFIGTAALEKVPGIEAAFRWLRKRGIRLALISGADRENTEILLQRLGWAVGEEELIQLVLVNQQHRENPIAEILQYEGNADGRLVFSLMDTPRLLCCARQCGIQLNLGVTNGNCSYNELAQVPNFALLDGPVQLPNFLLEHLPAITVVPRIGLRKPNNGWTTGLTGFSAGLFW